jgi:predicted acyl esterase
MSETAYGTGAFFLEGFLSWSEMITQQEQTTSVQAILRTMTVSRRLAPAVNGLPLADAADQVLDHRAPWFRAWLSHSDRGDAFWDRLNVTGALDKVSVPVRPTAEVARCLQPGGRLNEDQPAGAGPSSSFYYDPADPTPTMGGRLLTANAGVRDNRGLEARPDVLTFTTPPLASALEITGVPVVERPFP